MELNQIAMISCTVLSIVHGFDRGDVSISHCMQSTYFSSQPWQRVGSYVSVQVILLYCRSLIEGQDVVQQVEPEFQRLFSGLCVDYSRLWRLP